MQISLDPTQSAQSLGSILPGSPMATTPATGNDKSFGQYLTDAIAEVNAAQDKAGNLTMQYAAGKDVDVHDIMIASQEAGVMLNLATQVRNKLVDGFQEVMRIGM